MPFPFSLPLAFPPHSTTYEYFGVVAHVRLGEVHFCKVGDPIMELVVAHRDEAALFEVQGVSDRECCPTYVAMGQKFRWIDDVAQEEVIPPFLHP